MLRYEHSIQGTLSSTPQYVLSKEPELIVAWLSDAENLVSGMKKQIYSEHYLLKYLVNLTRDDKHTKCTRCKLIF